MKTKFDPKSLLVGALAAVVLACVAGASHLAGPEVGRFRIEANQEHAFVIDTATGRVWQKQFRPGRVTNHDAVSEFFGSKLDTKP